MEIAQIGTSFGTGQSRAADAADGTSGTPQTGSFQSLLQQSVKSAAKSGQTGEAAGSTEPKDVKSKGDGKDKDKKDPQCAAILPGSADPAAACANAPVPASGNGQGTAGTADSSLLPPVLPFGRIKAQDGLPEMKNAELQSAQDQNPVEESWAASKSAKFPQTAQSLAATREQTSAQEQLSVTENAQNSRVPEKAGDRQAMVNLQGDRQNELSISAAGENLVSGTLQTGSAEQLPVSAVKKSDLKTVEPDDVKPTAPQANAAEQLRLVPKAVQAGTTRDSTDSALSAGLPGTQTQPDSGEQTKKADRLTVQPGAQAEHFSRLYSDGKVVVKVSDAPQSAQTSPDRQVSDAVAAGLKNGRKELRVDLYPQSLGKVSVKLTTEKGMLTVEIAADNPKTQSLLAASSGDIRTMLQASTGQNVQVAKPQRNDQAPWYGPDGGSGQNNSGQQQRRQNDDRQNNSEAWHGVGNTAGVSTDDFLNMLRQIGA